MYVHGNEQDANSITIAEESAEARAAERGTVSNQFQNMAWSIISSLLQTESTVAAKEEVCSL